MVARSRTFHEQQAAPRRCSPLFWGQFAVLTKLSHCFLGQPAAQNANRCRVSGSWLLQNANTRMVSGQLAARLCQPTYGKWAASCSIMPTHVWSGGQLAAPNANARIVRGAASCSAALGASVGRAVGCSEGGGAKRPLGGRREAAAGGENGVVEGGSGRYPLGSSSFPSRLHPPKRHRN